MRQPEYSVLSAFPGQDELRRTGLHRLSSVRDASMLHYRSLCSYDRTLLVNANDVRHNRRCGIPASADDASDGNACSSGSTSCSDTRSNNASSMNAMDASRAGNIPSTRRNASHSSQACICILPSATLLPPSKKCKSH